MRQTNFLLPMSFEHCFRYSSVEGLSYDHVFLGTSPEFISVFMAGFGTEEKWFSWQTFC
jgi:hypothetical protein